MAQQINDHSLAERGDGGVGLSEVDSTNTKSFCRITVKAFSATIGTREARAIKLFIAEKLSDGSTILVNTRGSRISKTVLLLTLTKLLSPTYHLKSNSVGSIQRRDVVGVWSELNELTIIPTVVGVLSKR